MVEPLGAGGGGDLGVHVGGQPRVLRRAQTLPLAAPLLARRRRCRHGLLLLLVGHVREPAAAAAAFQELYQARRAVVQRPVMREAG